MEEMNIKTPLGFVSPHRELTRFKISHGTINHLRWHRSKPRMDNLICKPFLKVEKRTPPLRATSTPKRGTTPQKEGSASQRKENISPNSKNQATHQAHVHQHTGQTNDQHRHLRTATPLKNINSSLNLVFMMIVNYPRLWRGVGVT
jgi:hypothetical protein